MLAQKMELKGDIVENNNNKKGICLIWEDIRVVAPNNLKVLNGLSGYAEPNRIMALMGPSGSGKSTLLDAMAGIVSTNVSMSGNVLLNGTKRSTCCRDISYVTQEDYFLGTLTVRETLTYAAHLRLPCNMTKDEINKVVTKILDEMGLQDCADCRLGNWHLRGISNGEKRRLSISIEIITQPHILLLDEPTSGLDSAASFYVMSSLRSIAHNGRIVICSIHQPCSEVFNLFDDLLLLAAGETVFFGERTMAVKFFADAGFPCPTRKNPPEHFLRCVSAEFDSVATLIQSRNIKVASPSWNSSMNKTTKEIKSELIKNYKNSMHSAKAREKISEIKLREVPLIGRTYDTSMLKQLCTLTQRSFLNMCRDIGYYWLRIVFYILVSGCAGFLYFNIGTGSGAILSRGKCDGFIYGFMAFLCLGGLPFFLEELKVFRRERFGRHYGEGVYVLSSFLSSFPFVVAISLSSGTILYLMMNFHPGFSHYFYFCINLLCCISVTESCILLVAALVSNLLLAIGTATGIIVFMMMPTIIFRRLTDLPKFFWRYPMSYISYTAWSTQGQFKNDLIGLEFEPLVAGDAKIKGEVILQDTYGISTDYSKWWDLGALVCLIISYRLLFFLVLKHKERVKSLLHTKKTVLDILLRRPSLKDKYISSKRHQSLHPLSDQEGFGSPMA
ncbi:PREDICTED: ABC transporter G family member 12-like [Lupinus angustifolius]|nr:PREDICTED: ABC transporter G family member 12-like [Lupinus angustifolius]